MGELLQHYYSMDLAQIHRLSDPDYDFDMWWEEEQQKRLECEDSGHHTFADSEYCVNCGERDTIHPPVIDLSTQKAIP